MQPPVDLLENKFRVGVVVTGRDPLAPDEPGVAELCRISGGRADESNRVTFLKEVTAVWGESNVWGKVDLKPNGGKIRTNL